MKKISASFMAVVENSVFNKSEWQPKGDAYTLEEIFQEQGIKMSDIQGDEAEVIEVEFNDNASLRLEVPFKNGTRLQLKAGKGIQNNFDEGDKIKLSLIYGQELVKIGQPSIVRYDCWETEEEKNEYLAKRDA